jgi:hypothetical protein
VSFLVALGVSLLPERTRERAGGASLPLVAASFVTALAEVVLGVLIGFWGLPRYAAALAGYDTARGALGLDGQFALGATVYLGFFFSFWGFFALFAFTEGLVRTVGAVTGEPVGTTLAWLGERAWLTYAARRAQKELPPIVDDAHELAGDAWIVHACRPHPFSPGVVVTRDGVDWVCASADRTTDPARPHRYVMRPLAGSEAVRKRVPYTPRNQ